MPEPRLHAVDRNWLESLLRKVPGFKGYLEKEYRRDSDALQRTWLADRLQRSKAGLDTLTRRLADAGRIELIPELDRVRGRLDQLIGRIRGAWQGYSGVFDLVKVDEAVLDRVYEHDVALMERVDGVATAIERLAQSPITGAADLGPIAADLDAIEQSWNDREHVLKGLGNQQP